MLVEQAGIDAPFTVDFVTRQKPKCPELSNVSTFSLESCAVATYSVLNTDADERVIVGIDQGRKILSTISPPVASSVDPYQHW